MTKKEWFYPIQRNLADRLSAEYTNIETMYQVITNDKVFELKFCYPGNGLPPDQLLIVMSKQTGRFSIYKCIER